MKKECNLIGVFPPPYGGATVKCKLFSEMLQNEGYITHEIDIYEIKRKKWKLFLMIFKCIKAFCSKKPIIYCLDSKRLRVIMLIQNLFKNSFKYTTVLVIGGVFHEVLTEHPNLMKKLKRIKSIWVETEGMKLKLEEKGFKNIEVYPNPKSGKEACKPRITNFKEPLRLLFFSQISKEKGIYDIIKLVKMLNENNTITYSLDFYGHIVTEIQKDFYNFIKESENVKYCGIFDSTKSIVYQKINEYDILLFPTHWKGEGVPGILVEAKMSGIAVIASDCNYNKEVIQVGNKEGFLLHKNYSKEMYEYIKRLYYDRETLNEMKNSSYKSRKRFFIEKYKDLVKNVL